MWFWDKKIGEYRIKTFEDIDYLIKYIKFRSIEKEDIIKIFEVSREIKLGSDSYVWY